MADGQPKDKGPEKAKKAGGKEPRPDAGREAKLDGTAESDAKENGVSLIVIKRLRAANKKLKRIEEIEAGKALGKEINADQEEVLRGKARVLANIDELKALAPLLRDAHAEEVSNVHSQSCAEVKASAEAKADAEKKIVQLEKDIKVLEDEKAAALEAAEQAQKAERKMPESKLHRQKEEAERNAITRFLQIVYFSKLFNQDTAYIYEMERKACLSFDYSVDEKLGNVPLSEDELFVFHEFGKLLTGRPQGEAISHKDALQRCEELALAWVHNTDKVIPELNAYTVKQLSERFERVLQSDYVTQVPAIAKDFQEPGEAAPTGNGHGLGYPASDGPHTLTSNSRPQGAEEPLLTQQLEGSSLRGALDRQGTPLPQADASGERSLKGGSCDDGSNAALGGYTHHKGARLEDHPAAFTYPPFQHSLPGENLQQPAFVPAGSGLAGLPGVSNGTYYPLTGHSEPHIPTSSIQFMQASQVLGDVGGEAPARNLSAASESLPDASSQPIPEVSTLPVDTITGGMAGLAAAAEHSPPLAATEAGVGVTPGMGTAGGMPPSSRPRPTGTTVAGRDPAGRGRGGDFVLRGGRGGFRGGGKGGPGGLGRDHGPRGSRRGGGRRGGMGRAGPPPFFPQGPPPMEA